MPYLNKKSRNRAQKSLYCIIIYLSHITIKSTTMKHFLQNLNHPIGTDAYGTSDLTSLQLGLALILVGIFFAWMAHKHKQWTKQEMNK